MEICGLGSRRERRGVEVHGIGRAPVKSGMRASGVEEVDVANEAVACLADGVIGVQIHFFVLDRAPRPFEKDVVAPASATVHADARLVDIPAARWRVPDRAHNKRNVTVYSGDTEVEVELLAALPPIAQDLERRVGELPVPA